MAKICIYGAGSVGCYVGGRLLASGQNVSFVGRSGIGAELDRHGLTLTHFRGQHWQVPASAIDFSTDPAAAATADLVLVTVKSGATAVAGAELAAYLQPDAVIVSLQNGLTNAGVLRTILRRQPVLEGIVPFNIARRGPGAFHQASDGRLAAKDAAELKPFLPAFGKAGLALSLHADMLPVQWAKLLFNLNNPINALADLPLKQELSQRSYRRCLALAPSEALALLREAGILPARLTPLPAAWVPRLLTLPDALFERLGRKVLAIDPLARSSMSDDLAAGRPTEIDWINGEVLRLAERLGRQAPVNARLYALMRAAEAAESRPSWPARALLAELEAAAAGGPG